MKEPWEWEEEDIVRLVSDAEIEGISLEFKSCEAITKDGWKRDLAKNVSAFANSAGGTIIYGVIENRDTHAAERIDEGFDPKELNIETLEQVIASHIQRKIDGIICKPVDLNHTNPGRVVYLIHIPESTRAPHMADHRFYKRQQFSVTYMEEYEVRERYRRETFPGKEIVEAWRDDAINPLISVLEEEQKTLQDKRWTWNRSYREFSGLSKLTDSSQFSANKEDFIDRHRNIVELLRQHDDTAKQVNEAGCELFEQLSTTPFIRDMFRKLTAEKELQTLIAENPNRFRSDVPKEVFAELFPAHENEQERLDTFAEWSINGFSPANAPAFVTFWNAAKYSFYSLVQYPPLSEYRKVVEEARRKLLETNQRLIDELKSIRRDLSEKHNIAPQAPQRLGHFERQPFFS